MANPFHHSFRKGHPVNGPEPSATLIYVALGPNPAPTLNLFATYALEKLPGASAVLVTDRAELWEASFPGAVLSYSDSDRNPAIVLAESREVSRRLIANGYWVRALERIFALEKACEYIRDERPVIHFESDCFSQVTPEVLSELELRCRGAAVPSDAPSSGCASILFAPSRRSLLKGIEGLADILGQQSSWISDMELLGLGIKLGVLEELPTRPEHGWPIRVFSKDGETTASTLIFDASALGLYLFGKDPLHTEGKIMGGYQHVRFEHDLSSWQWDIQPSKAPNAADFLIELTAGQFGRIVPANLHVHSKELLPALKERSDFWNRLMGEANGTSTRLERTGNSPYRFIGLTTSEKLGYFWSQNHHHKLLLVRSFVQRMLAILTRTPGEGEKW